MNRDVPLHALTLTAIGALVALFGTQASADIFLLVTGGEIHGELVEPIETPPKRYIIEPYAGGRITLAASAVTKVVRQRPIEVAYEQVKLENGDTLDGNWQLAEWCRDNRLKSLRKKHLQRLLELDPDHAEARRLLRYDRVGDRWMTRDQVMEEKGYVKHQGRWRLPQEVALIEHREASKAREKEWFTKIRLWVSWLDGDKAVRAEEALASIKSVSAAPALIKKMESVKRERHRELLADAIANTKSQRGVMALVRHSVEFEESEDFRYHCFDLIERDKPEAAVGLYLHALKSKNNRHVNRAAIGLARLGDLTTIQPLIDALITEHKTKIGKSNPGAMTSSFGRGAGNQGSSFGTGGGAKVIKRTMKNEYVLSALVELTKKDFDYDVNAWKYWYATQRPASPRINTRRD